jgi:hypothetical protein
VIASHSFNMQHGSEEAVKIEGWLQKESRWLGRWHLRYVILFPGGRLCTYNAQPPTTNSRNQLPCNPSFSGSFGPTSSFVPIGGADEPVAVTEEIDVCGGHLEQKDAPLAASLVSFRFAVVIGRRRVWFAAGTIQDRRRWLHELQAEMSAPSRASRLSLSATRMTHARAAVRQGHSPSRSFSTLTTPPTAAVPEPECEADTKGDMDESFSPRKFLEDRRGTTSPGASIDSLRLSRQGAVEGTNRAESIVPRAVDGLQGSTKMAKDKVIDDAFEEDGGNASADEPAAEPAIRQPSPVASSVAIASHPSALPQQGAQLVAESPPADMVIAAPQAPPVKGKGKGKGKPPSKAPPPGGPPPKAKAKPWSANKDAGGQLPLGRRLPLRAKTFQAEVFNSLLGPAPESLNEADQLDQPDPFACAPLPSPRQRQRLSLSVDPKAVNLAVLRKQFTPQTRASTTSRASRTRVELLSRDVAHKLAIVLARVGVDTSKLAAILHTLEPSDCMLSPDQAARLLDVWPGYEALDKLVEYANKGSDLTKLRDVERRILPLAQLPRMGARLRLMILQKNFG